MIDRDGRRPSRVQSGNGQRAQHIRAEQPRRTKIPSHASYDNRPHDWLIRTGQSGGIDIDQRRVWRDGLSEAADTGKTMAGYFADQRQAM